MKSSKTSNLTEQAPSYGVRLSELERRFGSDLVRVVPAAVGNDPLVQAYDVYDASNDDAYGEGVLLSLISAGVMRTKEIQRALTQAAQDECAAIAVKAESTEILTLIYESGLPALVLSAEVSWREFDALLTRILGESAQSLSSIPSQGDKLFALANTIAREFGGSVAIEDHQRSILAHSSVSGQAIDELRTTGILFRRAGDAPVNEGRYQEVLAADGIVRFQGFNDFMHRAAIAVRAGAIPLGTIWVLDPNGDNPAANPLSHEKEQILLQGAVLAADAMLEARQSNSGDDVRRVAIFKRLLVGAAQPGDREVLDPTGGGQCVILVGTVEKGPSAAVRVAELRALLGRHLAMYMPELLLFAEGHELVVLCPTSRVETVRGWVIAALAELGDESASAVQIGLSDPHAIRSRLPYALSEARDVVRCAQSAGEVVGTVSRVRAQLYLSVCGAQLELDDRLVLPEVRDLLGDGASGAQAIETLECWLQEIGNVAKTAQRLRVHEQTVRYRLKGLRERLALDSDDPDHLLTVWSQVRALRGTHHAHTSRS